MKILITDHRPFVRSGLSAILSAEPEFNIIGEVESGVQAIQSIKQHSPDLLISNWRFGTTSGLELIKELRKEGYAGKTLLLAEHVTKREFSQVKALHIEGLIASTAIQEEFIHALNLLRLGRRYYDSHILESFLETPSVGPSKSDPYHQLTEKELEVLQALGHGLSNRQIAESLFVTEYTVKKHVSQVLSKLELADRTHAALYANARGIACYEVSV